MLPLRDLNPTHRTPVLTYLLIAINVGVFLLQLGMSQEQLFLMYIDQSVVPRFITTTTFSLETILDALRSMFFHGGWLHLISNMLYLWIFGDNIEDRLGKVWFLVLYFASGIAAIVAQVAVDPSSEIPLVGASGAIAGVLGAYALLYPGARVQSLVFFGYFASSVQLSALVVLGFWFVTQLFSGAASLGVDTMTGGVAFFAHIGGFVAGLGLAWLFTRFLPPPEPRQTVYWPE